MTDEDYVTQLEDEVKQLRAMLKLQPGRNRIDRLMIALGLTRCQAILVATLYDAGESYVPTRTLNKAIPEKRNSIRDPETMKVHIFNIQERLGDGAVVCAYGLGYSLGEPGIAACKRALGEAEAA